MAWQPVKRKQTGLSPRAREVVSKITMILAGLALCYASYKCFRASGMMADAMAETSQRTSVRGSTAGGVILLPFLGGVACGLLGLALVGCAVVTPKFLEQFNAPPGDPHEEADRLRRRIRRGGF